MTLLDRILQRWRITKAKRFLKPGMRVLDIGCGEGELFAGLDWLSKESVGLEPTLAEGFQSARFRALKGYFPQDIPAETQPFDAITMLAVLEHFPESVLSELGAACQRYLKPGGLIVITVPSPAVDQILTVLKTLRLVHGMALEEHHGYDVRQTVRVFPTKDFEVICHRKFQLGLNNLFVFRRRG